MRVSSESLCLCNSRGKSDRLKTSIYSSMNAAMVRLYSLDSATTSFPGLGNSGASDGRKVCGTGFLIHCGLLLTTHVNLPSVSAAQCTEIRLQNGTAATLFPHRFFITSSVLDLTIVSVESTSNNGEDSNSKSRARHHFRIPSLELGNIIYLLGHTRKEELTIIEGRVVITTDNLIKLSTNNGVSLSHGSAGFDSHGNLAFIICHPMRLSLNTKSSLSSTFCEKDLRSQFGIPMSVIYDWLNQHLENSLIAKMVCISDRHHHHHFSCTSFNMRQLFRSSETVLRSPNLPLPISSYPVGSRICDEDTTKQLAPSEPNPSLGMIHAQGIPTPQLYESPRVTSVPIQKKDALATLLGWSLPSSVPAGRISLLPQQSDKKSSEEIFNVNPVKEEVSSSSSTYQQNGKGLSKSMVQSRSRRRVVESNRARPAPARIEYGGDQEEIEAAGSSGSVNNHNGFHSEVESSSPPPIAVFFTASDRPSNSEVESMYSPETAESTNCPRQSDKATITSNRFHQLGERSHGCVNHGRRAVLKYPVMVRRRSARLDQLKSLITTPTPKRSCSSGSTTQQSSDYITPTVSSTRKKMSGRLEQSRPQFTVPRGGGGSRSRKKSGVMR